jgi:hypothetical protein
MWGAFSDQVDSLKHGGRMKKNDLRKCDMDSLYVWHDYLEPILSLSLMNQSLTPTSLSSNILAHREFLFSRRSALRVSVQYSTVLYEKSFDLLEFFPRTSWTTHSNYSNTLRVLYDSTHYSEPFMLFLAV